MEMTKILSLLVVIAFVGTTSFVGSMAQAASGDADVQEENVIKKIARSKSYPGGVDEEPLKVQAQLPTIKKDGQNEAEAPESGDAD